MSQEIGFCISFPYSCPFIIWDHVKRALPHILGGAAVIGVLLLWFRLLTKGTETEADPDDPDYGARHTGMKCQHCGKRFEPDTARNRPWLCKECDSDAG